MKTWFWWREEPDGTFAILPMYKNFPEDWCIMGSWSVLPARLLGLSWPDYLRFCIQQGATVTGKNHLYPIIKWKKKNEALMAELNKRANILIRI